MWIMLLTKLPTAVSPPKLSIHWSEPWPYGADATIPSDEKSDAINAKRSAHKTMRRKLVYAFKMDDEEDAPADEEVVFEECPAATFAREDSAFGYSELGCEPNPRMARAIVYNSEKIRVWAHEFSVMTPEKMRAFILEDEAYEIVSCTTAGQVLIGQIETTDQRFVYDAALLDGCNEAQAMHVALGGTIGEDQIEFPAIGWYKLKDEYASAFCTEREMEG